MFNYTKLMRRPPVFQRTTGLSPEAFQSLTARFASGWQAAEVQRLNRPDRRHALGGGHPYHLKNAQDMVGMFLVLCRTALTWEFAGLLFGFDGSNVRKLFFKMVPVMQAAADPELSDYLVRASQERQAHPGSIHDWAGFLKKCPDLAEVAVDSTEQPRQRPGKKRVRKRYYSGKSKRFTIKTGIVVSKSGRVLHVSGGYPGPINDKRLYETEKLPALIPRETRQFLDLGYKGLDADHPGHDLRLPYKRHSPGCQGRGQTGPPLTRGQKQANGLRRRRRVVVEHALARIKTFKIASAPWRGRVERHNPVFRAVAALNNFRLAA